LRLAVTDRCNLRCFYCMPHEGLNWLERKEIMSYEEMLRLSSILVRNGIEKIRITGGEPFVRKDIMGFLEELSRLKGLKELSITTNGVLTAPFITDLKRIGVRSVNLSLDTLDTQRFYEITRRDELDKVLNTLQLLQEHEIDVKLNAVVMEGKNIEDIIPLVELTKDQNIDVRFIEEMPFNGEGHSYSALQWDHFSILEKIKSTYPDIYKTQDAPHSTSYNYHVPGHKGNVGIIAAYTRSFCGTCNRIRVTPDGTFKTCLYDDGVMNVRDLLRSGSSDAEILGKIVEALGHKPKDGWEAERSRSTNKQVTESMATIGG
jgi:molybdenum cofactor biosynthesis protein A